MSANIPTPERPNFDSGLTDEETAAVVASARQTPERVTLTDEERALGLPLYVDGAQVGIVFSDVDAENILAAREQALREEMERRLKSALQTYWPESGGQASHAKAVEAQDRIVREVLR